MIGARRRQDRVAGLWIPLGRCSRVADAPSSCQPYRLCLHKINGDWLNKKVADPDSTLHSLIRPRRGDAEIIAHLSGRLEPVDDTTRGGPLAKRLAAVPTTGASGGSGGFSMGAAELG